MDPPHRTSKDPQVSIPVLAIAITPIAPMLVEIDPNSGFCFGVVRAIELAEAELKNQQHLLCLGDIVHNGAEVQRLETDGLQTIYYPDLPQYPGKRILFRAHGEPPTTYQQAQELGMQIVDATCPVVLQLQRRVKKAGERLLACQGQIVIFGKPDHAEVNGLRGQTSCLVHVVQSVADLNAIDWTRPTECFSQTTMSAKDYKTLTEAIAKRMRKIHGAKIPLQINESTCHQVANRHESIQTFAREHDAILFVSGKKSSNGKMLFEECQKVNPRTYFTTGIEDIRTEWLAGVQRLGICGATSTPRWLMEAVEKQATEISNRQTKRAYE